MENPCPAANLWLHCLLLGTRHPARWFASPKSFQTRFPPATCRPTRVCATDCIRCAQLAGRRPRLLTAHARQKSGRATLQNLSTSLSSPQSPLSSPRERICGGTSQNLRLQSLRLRERSPGGDRLFPIPSFCSEASRGTELWKVEWSER